MNVRRGCGLLAALVAVTIVLAGATLWRDARAVAVALDDLRRELIGSVAGQPVRGEDAGRALVAGRAVGEPATAGRLTGAEQALARAEAIRAGRLWRLGHRVPVVRDQLAATDDLVEAADVALRIAGPLLVALDAVDVPDGGDAGRSVDLDGLEAAREALRRAPLDRLRRVAVRLERPVRWAPSDLVAARAAAVLAVEDAKVTLARLGQVLDLVPDMLGADGPRRYLLAMQNNAELRGTGGLIGFYAVLEADDGELTLSTPRRYTELVGGSETTAEVSAAFAARYDHVAATTFLANANVDPDLPTSAPIVLGIAEAQLDVALDGLVVVDPIGMTALLSTLEPIAVPPHVPTAGIASPLPPEQLARTVLHDAYRELGGDTDDRRAYLTALASAAFDGLVSAPVTDPAFLRRAGAAVRGRHLQLHARRPAEQRALTELGVAGALRATTPGGDLVAVTANNAGANKQDVFVRHHVRLDVQLGDLAGARPWRAADVEVTLHNDTPRSGLPRYVTGSAPADGRRFVGQTGADGLNRTWFTVWSPGAADLDRARDADGRPLPLLGGTIHGHRAFDHHLEVPWGRDDGFTLRSVAPVAPTVHADGTRGYHLSLWRQAKAVADEWTVTVLPPPGWRIVDVRVTGGRSDLDVAVTDDRRLVDRPPRLRWRADEAVLDASVTADLDLRVDLRPSAAG